MKGKIENKETNETTEETKSVLENELIVILLYEYISEIYIYRKLLEILIM